MERIFTDSYVQKIAHEYTDDCTEAMLEDILIMRGGITAQYYGDNFLMTSYDGDRICVLVNFADHKKRVKTLLPEMGKLLTMNVEDGVKWHDDDVDYTCDLTTNSEIKLMHISAKYQDCEIACQIALNTLVKIIGVVKVRRLIDKYLSAL